MKGAALYSMHTWIGTIQADILPDPFRVRRIWLPGTYQPETCKTGVLAGSQRLTNKSAVAELRILDQMVRAYLELGKPLETPWQWLCQDHLTPLQLQVLRLTAEIPYGRVRTYRDIAADMGKPAAARFVGNALAANPWPLLIPCHRVIRTNGAVGGFGGGTGMKTRLIKHETGAKHPLLAHRW